MTEEERQAVKGGGTQEIWIEKLPVSRGLVPIKEIPL